MTHVTQETYDALVAELEQERAITKAACELADRYKRERDGARAETIAVKSKVADAGHSGPTLRDAIQKALDNRPSPGGDRAAALDFVAANTARKARAAT